MRFLNRCISAGVIFACGSLAQAQTTGGTTQGGTAQGGTIEVVQVETPTITSTSNGGVQQSNAVSASNGLAPYYANPLYQGRAGAQTGSLTTVNPAGGFGVALYGTTGISGATGAGGTGGAAGTAANRTTAARTGVTGATTLGGATGARNTGLGGTAGRVGGAGTFGTAGTNGTTNQNTGLTTGRSIAYTQTLKFTGAAPLAPGQLQADLQATISGSSAFTSSGVQVSAGEGGVVVLRGIAADDDEARLIEGLIRLTPGVKDVKNELTIK
jgi:osmotically-inducible protein OsmY